MLDRRNQQPADRFTRPPAQSRRQRQRVRFLAALFKHHIRRPGADGCRDGRAGVLDQPAGLTSLGMDGGRFAGDFPGSPVQLTFGFVFTDDGHIAALTIRP